MYYFLFVIPLLIYFELLGRYILFKFKREPLDFSFIIGFLFTMAALYILGWPISAFNGPSIAYVTLILVFVLVTVILILKNIKRINLRFDWKLWIIFAVLLVSILIVSYNRTLGEPHGFDALYYINYIGFNVDTNALNTNHPHFGTTPNNYKDTVTYVFQAYYYFVSSFIYIVKKAGSLIGLTIETLPTLVWTFQILSSAILVGASIISVKELQSKNKILNIAFIILLVLFIGNFYYNNAYGWIGNNFRMSIHSIATIYLFRYFKDKNKNDMYLFYMCMLGMCGVASTGTFAFIFVLFGLFFVLYNKEKNLLKEYAIVLFIPTLNILSTKLGVHWWLPIALFVVFAIIYFLNDLIMKLYQNKYLRFGTIAALALFMLVASAIYTGSVFDIHIFFTNYSEIQDMSWDYFMFDDIRHWIFNLLVLIPMFYYLIKERNKPISVIAWVLIICIYNPFCCSFMNKVNWVYYRTYDIIINQYTLIFFIEYLINSLKFKKVLTGIVLCSSIALAILQIPRYYHDQFIPDEDYNPFFKIENSELEMIYGVRELIKEYDIQNPAIITPAYYMPTFFKDSTYLIGKEKRYNWDEYSDITYELYTIFYPSEGYYDGFGPTERGDFKNAVQLLQESDYDILIVDFGWYEEIDGEYQSVVEYIEKSGIYTHSEYSTNKYAIFYLG